MTKSPNFRPILIIPFLFACILLAIPSIVFAAPQSSTNQAIYPVVEDAPECPQDQTIYPPNGECYSPVLRTQTNLDLYPLTTICEPIMDYSEERTVAEYNQCYQTNGDPCDVYLTAGTDVSKATLGGYGPNNAILNKTNPDTIAKEYIFNSFFDLPISPEKTTREAFRTWWRLQDSYLQAQTKANFISNHSTNKDKLVFTYINSSGKPKDTDTAKLNNSLPSCLTSDPICPEYYLQYNSLNDDVKAQYDTLIPFSFEEMRGYLAIETSTKLHTYTEVAREQKPYIEAAFEGLLDKLYGVITSVQPSWLGEKTLKTLTDNNTDYVYKPKDNPDALVLQHAIMKTCEPRPIVYHRGAPRTYPTGDIFMKQNTKLPGASLSWTEIDSPPEYDPDTGDYYCPDRIDTLIGDTCVHYVSSFSNKRGKAITVLNNPKTADIRDTLVKNRDVSLHSTLLPDFALTPTPKIIDAPEAYHYAVISERVGKSPAGTMSVDNPEEPIYRESNYGLDAMRELKTKWLVPCALQDPPNCEAPSPSPTNLCTGEAFAKISANPPQTSSKAQSYFQASILPNLTDEVIKAYAEAEAKTGVPCEILAGIHFEEGDNDPNRNLQDGGPLSGSLTDSAIQAAEQLKAINPLATLDNVVAALSAYNGGGNSNCQPSFACPNTTDGRCGATVACSTSTSSCTCNPGYALEPGSCRATCEQIQPGAFPFSFSYPYCPPQGPGYDDPYAVNWWLSPQHDTMYLLYMYDCTATQPQVHTRPGALTVAIDLYYSEQQ